MGKRNPSMPIKFEPRFEITPAVARALLRIERAAQEIADLPVTPTLLATLRETARLAQTHYSTMIEGNRLTQEQVEEVVKHHEHFPGRERDEAEVKGYYVALEEVEQLANIGLPISEKDIARLHALVMGRGSKRVKPTPYRDGQSVIRESGNGNIVYLPPEAKDVGPLIAGLVEWVEQNEELPCPLLAGIAHYQYATIHAYYDGNGRTARLLTTLILHLGGYGFKGIYSLEEYYARNLAAYYVALNVGPSHNYYLGRAEADITGWIDYFCAGMAEACENVVARARQERATPDQFAQLRKLDPKQRKALDLFREREEITSKDVQRLFGYQPRTASQLCRNWAESGFIEVVDPSRKSRRYRLADRWSSLP
jgi:cell filamentation protein, protein adenylyltransferase